MYTRVPDEFLAQLLERVDIVEVISEHVRLTRRGRSYIGLCPFHSEKSPSFDVKPGKGYHCFGCGAGGTAITFLMELEQLTFREAVERLAQRAGLPLPILSEVEDTNDPGAQKRVELLRAHDLAAKLYNHIVMNLDVGTQGLSYFLNRGLTKKTIAQYGLGYSPATGTVLVDFLSKRGFSRELMLESGLCLQSDRGQLFDRFRGRVMFPVWDLQGRVIAFGARTLGSDQPKYLNSPETPLFTKGRSLYGYHKARQAIRKAGKVLLLEGYMDVLALHQAGILHAVAGLGTALTPDQATLLNRVAETVVLLYDGDSAGQQAAQKSLAICREAGAAVMVAMLPEGEDPDEWIRERGAETFRDQVIDRAVGALDFQLEVLKRAHPQHLTRDRIPYLADAVTLIAREDSALGREAAIERLAREYAMSPAALRDDVHKLAHARDRSRKDKIVNERNTEGDSFRRNYSSAVSGPLPERHEVAARLLLTFMMQDPALAREVQSRFDGVFPGELAGALQAYIYRFYGDRQEADPQWLISCIEDPQVVYFAAELMHRADDEPVSESVGKAMVEDALKCLRDHERERAIKMLERQMSVAVSSSDFAAFRELQEQVARLR